MSERSCVNEDGLPQCLIEPDPQMCTSDEGARSLSVHANFLAMHVHTACGVDPSDWPPSDAEGAPPDDGEEGRPWVCSTGGWDLQAQVPDRDQGLSTVCSGSEERLVTKIVQRGCDDF